MSPAISITWRHLARTLPVILLSCGMNALADSPGWWESGDPPAIDPAAEANNHGPASVGQAKWMVTEALRALEPIAPAIGDEIRSDLSGIVDLSVPDPKTDPWRAKQKAPLTLGQLKAIARPFYNHLNAESSSWVLDQIEDRNGGTATADTHYWQITGNANYTSGGYFPWNPATTSATNKETAVIGQLKSVFSLDFSTFVTAPPENIYEPEIYTGYVYYPEGGRTLAGQTLVVWPGEWDVSHGGKVTGYWYDVTRGIQLGEDNEFEYTVTQADVDAESYIIWVANAVQGGDIVSTTTAYGIFAKEPWTGSEPHFDNPYAAIHGMDITGSHASGATLTKADLRWLDPVEGYGLTPAMFTTGEWYKNGIATGVHTSTYADTDDGDVITYAEFATNALGDSILIHSTPFPVSDGLAAYQEEVVDAFDALIDGESGSSDMELFSSENHSTPAYTRNTSLWAAPLVPKLTGVSAWKSHGDQSYGGVLITPRHILYCQHGHPRGYGSWKSSAPAALTVRFVLEDNTVVDATQLCQSEWPETEWTPTERAAYVAAHPEILDVAPASLPDLCVAVLDRDIDVEGVQIVPIAGRNKAEYDALTANGLPYFHISQGKSGGSPPTPISSYPAYNKMMACVRAATGNVTESDPPYDDLDYSLWDGDSGTPTFVLHRGVPYLESVIYGQNYQRTSVGPKIAWVNAMIAAADAGAIELGHMTTPTGYTVSVSALPSD